MRFFLVLFAAVILAGCSMTLPVDGRLGEDDRFLGEATGYITGNGTIAVISAAGRKCSGTFKYLTSATGEGQLGCDDGRTGAFVFNSSGTRGNGFGTLSDGERFAFAFGDPSHSKNFRE